LGLRPAPEFEAWLEDRGVLRDRRLAPDETAIHRQLVREVEAILS
jgi:ethanolamine ammonia-lyase large subunit